MANIKTVYVKDTDQRTWDAMTLASSYVMMAIRHALDTTTIEPAEFIKRPTLTAKAGER